MHCSGMSVHLVTVSVKWRGISPRKVTGAALAHTYCNDFKMNGEHLSIQVCHHGQLQREYRSDFMA